MENISEQREFSKVIKSLNPTNFSSNPIETDAWINYFQEWYNDRTTLSHNYFHASHPYLDMKITEEELTRALKNLKTNKSPGLHGIVNEQLRNLPPAGFIYLRRLLYDCIEQDELSRSLKQIKIILILKQGERENLNNYRGIAQVNTYKLFTYILNNRLHTWIEEHK